MALVALAGSQLGHLVAYQLRLGPQGAAVQSQGAHEYFPALLGASAAALGAALLVSLLVVGTARVLIGRQKAWRRTGGLPLLETLAFLFTVQLVIYAGQELVESWLLAAPPSDPTRLLLWGAAGQLPVAAVAALSLVWISSRIEGAVEVIRTALRPPFIPAVPPAPVLPDLAPTRLASLQACAPSVFVKRGPPANLLHHV